MDVSVGNISYMLIVVSILNVIMMCMSIFALFVLVKVGKLSITALKIYISKNKSEK